MEETEVKPLISCMLTYEYNEHRHEKSAASLFADRLIISSPTFSSTLKLNRLLSVSAQNYKVYAQTDSGVIVFSMIGHLFEDFAFRFIRAYNEVIFNDSLMKERVHFEADGQYISSDNEISHAAFRICETALVVLPDTHGLVRIPFCMIAGTNITPYRFEIKDRLGRLFVLQKLGRSTDPFLNAFKTRVSELKKQTRELLSTISPVSDDLAELLMEGMVANLCDVRSLSPAFADALEEKLSSSDISQEYGYLKSVSSYIAVGIKRGLMGELTGESILLLSPVFEKNVMFLESLGDAAAATYVFRISENGKMPIEKWGEFLTSFNYSMLSVNFRREPVYLSDDALKSEKYEQYAQALRRVPGLLQLRALFLGRVKHSGFESWKKAMDSYIK